MESIASRRSFVQGLGAAFAVSLAPGIAASAPSAKDDPKSIDYAALQADIDNVTARDYAGYYYSGRRPKIAPPRTNAPLGELLAKFPALKRIEDSFEKILKEIRSVRVTDGNRPAIWYLYNMGVIVKTKKSLFGIDVHHRRAGELAELLDFALVTHGHGDHFSYPLFHAMTEKLGKTVVQNFNHKGKAVNGYTPEKSKTYRFKDVTVITGRCDHNANLINFTTPFEVHIGSFTLYHSGDCSSHAKLKTERTPDMWIFHPYCGMNPPAACREAIKPKLAVVAHLQELGHEKNKWRWTYSDGLRMKAAVESAGFKAIMPLWGERIA